MAPSTKTAAAAAGKKAAASTKTAAAGAKKKAPARMSAKAHGRVIPLAARRDIGMGTPPKTPPAKMRAPAFKGKRGPAKMSARAPKKVVKTNDCPICLQPIADDSKRSLRSAGLAAVDGCAHEFCQNCLAKYCSVALKDNKGLETGGALPCPVPQCKWKGVLTPGEVKALVPDAEWEQSKERRAAHQVLRLID
jgi:hypothetical protein